MTKQELGKIKHDNEFHKILNEIQILGDFNHNNVVRLLEVLDDKRFPLLYMILEFAERGELLELDMTTMRYSLPDTNEPYMEEKEIRKVTREIVDGLNYCRFKSTLKRDYSQRHQTR